MTEEFRKAAEKEIIEDLDGISQILISCKNNLDVKKNSTEIENYLHKIKGLAPMMDQKGMGEIASLNDLLIKKIIEGKIIDGILETINESNQLMKNLLQDSSIPIDELKQTIKTKHSMFLD